MRHNQKRERMKTSIDGRLIIDDPVVVLDLNEGFVAESYIVAQRVFEIRGYVLPLSIWAEAIQMSKDNETGHYTP